MNDYTSGQGSTLQQVLENGFSFSIPKKYTGSLSKKKARTFVIKPLALCTVSRVVEQGELLNYDEDRISDDPMQEVRQLSKSHSYKCCKIIALATWPDATLIPGILPLLSMYLYYHIDAARLWHLQNMVNVLCNFPTLINCIRSLSACQTTKPILNKKEQQPEVAEVED